MARLRCPLGGTLARANLWRRIPDLSCQRAPLAPAIAVSVLSVQAVAKRYGERLVFSDISFRLAHGDRVGLVGPNGVGKTTLLRVAAGPAAAAPGGMRPGRGRPL